VFRRFKDGWRCMTSQGSTRRRRVYVILGSDMPARPWHSYEPRARHARDAMKAVFGRVLRLKACRRSASPTGCLSVADQMDSRSLRRFCSQREGGPALAMTASRGEGSASRDTRSRCIPIRDQFIAETGQSRRCSGSCELAISREEAATPGEAGL
jgi:hypothetical protein